MMMALGVGCASIRTANSFLDVLSSTYYIRHGGVQGAKTYHYALEIHPKKDDAKQFSDFELHFGTLKVPMQMSSDTGKNIHLTGLYSVSADFPSVEENHAHDEKKAVLHYKKSGKPIHIPITFTLSEGNPNEEMYP